MKKTIGIIAAPVLSLYLHFFLFTGERTIAYYSNGKCTLTQVIYDNWGGTWTDLYYGKIGYEYIDENRCFIRCEVRGGLNGYMQGYVIFHNDSITIAPHAGAFFKYNCNNDKLFLLDNYHNMNNTMYIDYGRPRKKLAQKCGINVMELPSQKTTRFFNTTFERDACIHYNSNEQR